MHRTETTAEGVGRIVCLRDRPTSAEWSSSRLGVAVYKTASGFTGPDGWRWYGPEEIGVLAKHLNPTAREAYREHLSLRADWLMGEVS